MHNLTVFDLKQSVFKLHLTLFCLPLFFILTAEAAMGYAFPVIIINSNLSNTTLGAILSVSALMGLLCDFIFPVVLKNQSWKIQLGLGVVLALCFPFLTLMGLHWRIPFLFLVASFCWYIYYELILFSEQNFVTFQDKTKNYSQDWGTIYLVAQTASLTGPIIASLSLRFSSLVPLIMVLLLNGISLLFTLFCFTQIKSRTRVESPIQQSYALLKELHYYKIFSKKIWYVIILAMTAIFAQEVFWNFGGILGETYQPGKGTGWLVMASYLIPMTLGPLVLSRFKITKGKKRLSIIGLIVSGLILSCMIFFSGYWTLLSIIFLSGLWGSFVSPLYEAVFSDFLSRINKSKMYLVSLIRVTSSISCIISPLVTGFIADATNYKFMFGIVGFSSALVGIFLLFLTPLKIKLSQEGLKDVETRTG